MSGIAPGWPAPTIAPSSPLARPTRRGSVSVSNGRANCITALWTWPLRSMAG